MGLQALSRSYQTQAPVNAIIDDTHHRSKDVIIQLDSMAKPVCQHPEMLHMAQRILDNDTLAGELAIGELLVSCQGMIPPGLVRCAYTPLGVVVLQPIKARITNDGDLLRNLMHHV